MHASPPVCVCLLLFIHARSARTHAQYLSAWITFCRCGRAATERRANACRTIFCTKWKLSPRSRPLDEIRDTIAHDTLVPHVNVLMCSCVCVCALFCSSLISLSCARVLALLSLRNSFRHQHIVRETCPNANIHNIYFSRYTNTYMYHVFAHSYGRTFGVGAGVCACPVVGLCVLAQWI